MYRVVFILMVLLISCDEEAQVKPKLSPVLKKKEDKPKPVEQSFKKAVEILCNSIGEVGSKDAFKLSQHLEKKN